MKIYTKVLKFITRKNVDLINITEKVREIVKESGIKEGFVNVFTLHTTSAIIINEDEPGLEKDFVEIVKEVFPESDDYRFHHHYHKADGRMAVNAWAHFRSSFLGPQVIVPIRDNNLLLGARQNIYFFELDGPHERTVVVQVIGL